MGYKQTVKPSARPGAGALKAPAIFALEARTYQNDSFHKGCQTDQVLR